MVDVKVLASFVKEPCLPSKHCQVGGKRSLSLRCQFKIKDGCRGGREQFTWNSIKEQEFKDLSITLDSCEYCESILTASYDEYYYVTCYILNHQVANT